MPVSSIMVTRTGIIALDAMLAVMSERMSSATCSQGEQVENLAKKNTGYECKVKNKDADGRVRGGEGTAQCTLAVTQPLRS